MSDTSTPEPSGDEKRPPASTPPGPQAGAPAPQPGAPAPQPGPYGQPGPYYGQPVPPSATGAYPPPPLLDADQRLYSTLAHALGIPFSFVVPLIVYLVFRDRGAYVRYQSREALNFQLTVLICYVAAIIPIIGWLVAAAAGICSLVFGIMAAVATNRGEPYQYPISIRMITQ